MLSFLRDSWINLNLNSGAYCLRIPFGIVFLITVPVFYAKSRFFQNAGLLGAGLVYPGLVMDHFPSEMSGGEQQRVAVARALVNNPKILFADEPCANLDSETSKVILDLFKRLNKELGQTIILVTHEPEDEKYVDRVIHMKDGILQ